LRTLKQNNFPYIGFVYDGFEELHKESKEYGIELLFHRSDSCILCKQEKKKEKIKNSTKENKEKIQIYKILWHHEEKMKYQDLKKILKDEECKMFFGSLLEYKSRYLGDDIKNILIILNNKEFKFDIYKFLYNINQKSKSGYYGLGIEDESKDIYLIKLEQIYIFNIIKLYANKENKSILNFEIIKQEKDKKRDKKNGKDNNTRSTYDLSIDFSSSNDSKNFFFTFKDIAQAFKNKNVIEKK